MVSRKLAYASRASEHRPTDTRRRSAQRAKVPPRPSRSSDRFPLSLLLGVPLLGFLSFMVLAHAWMSWQVQQLHQQQAKLREVFVCTERRFNNPGTYAGTRCLPPNEALVTPLVAPTPAGSPPAP
jgi:hypothetical protein